MAKTDQNFEMYQGDSKELHVEVTDENGNIIDLTGATVTWKMYKDFSSSAIVKNISNGISIPTPTNGVFIVTLEPVDTETFVGGYFHEAQVRDIRGMVTTVMTGNIKVKRKHA
jgi:hypothetical protein